MQIIYFSEMCADLAVFVPNLSYIFFLPTAPHNLI